MQTNESDEGGKVKYQTLVLDDTKYKTILTPKFENRKPWVRPDERKIYSFLPGTIQKISIKKGDKIKEGQVLVIFEAMKMINTVRANQSGTIKDVYISVGDKIHKGFLMFEFE